MSWRPVARVQDGVISAQQFMAAGISRTQIARLAGRGDLCWAARGVYLVGGPPDTYRSTLWVALLSTRGLLAFDTAAHRRLHKLVRSAGIAGWRANYRVWVGGELVAVIDLAFVAARLAIEIDGMA